MADFDLDGCRSVYKEALFEHDCKPAEANALFRKVFRAVE